MHDALHWARALRLGRADQQQLSLASRPHRAVGRALFGHLESKVAEAMTRLFSSARQLSAAPVRLQKR